MDPTRASRKQRHAIETPPSLPPHYMSDFSKEPVHYFTELTYRIKRRNLNSVLLVYFMNTYLMSLLLLLLLLLLAVCSGCGVAVAWSGGPSSVPPSRRRPSSLFK